LKFGEIVSLAQQANLPIKSRQLDGKVKLVAEIEAFIAQ
jgi:hypothetical protein